jgi:hypothetical protein
MHEAGFGGFSYYYIPPPLEMHIRRTIVFYPNQHSLPGMVSWLLIRVQTPGQKLSVRCTINLKFNYFDCIRFLIINMSAGRYECRCPTFLLCSFSRVTTSYRTVGTWYFEAKTLDLDRRKIIGNQKSFFYPQILNLIVLAQAGDANDREPASGAEHEALARDDLREGQREEHSHQRHGQRARQVIAAGSFGDPDPHVF